MLVLPLRWLANRRESELAWVAAGAWVGEPGCVLGPLVSTLMLGVVLRVLVVLRLVHRLVQFVRPLRSSWGIRARLVQQTPRALRWFPRVRPHHSIQRVWDVHVHHGNVHREDVRHASRASIVARRHR